MAGEVEFAHKLLCDNTHTQRARHWRHASMLGNCLSVTVTTAAEDTLHKSKGLPQSVSTHCVNQWLNYICYTILRCRSSQSGTNWLAVPGDLDLIYVAFDMVIMKLSHRNFYITKTCIIKYVLCDVIVDRSHFSINTTRKHSLPTENVCIAFNVTVFHRRSWQLKHN